MSTWLEVHRFPSVGARIAQRLGVDPPECRMVTHGRFTITFRRLGATRWTEPQQLEYAFRAVDAARAAFAEDSRRNVKRGARWATVVVFEDSTTVNGCAIVARWECVVPAEQRRDD